MFELANNTTSETRGDTNSTLPNTTFQSVTKKVGYSPPQNAPPGEDASFLGPEVNGRPTRVTQFTPSQLIESPLIPSLFRMINNAYRSARDKAGVIYIVRDRLQTEDDLLSQLGYGRGTFIYVIQYAATNEVVATAAARR